MKRWYVIAPLAGAAVGAGAFLLGVQGWRPILVGVVVAAFLLWAPRFWPQGIHLPWPRAGGRVYSGGSQQVSRLASSLVQRADSKRLPDPALQYRLRRLAVARLHRLGVGWNDARALELLGDVHGVLTADTFVADLAEVERIVAAIERLDETTPYSIVPRSVRADR